MSGTSRNAAQPESPSARTVADAYVQELAQLDPVIATQLGLEPAADRLPDLSPAGSTARDELARRTLAELDAAERAAAARSGGSGDRGTIWPGPGADHERRCARLLRERLNAGLASRAAGEQLRDMSNVFGPVSGVRGALMLMPAGTLDDWAVIARRLNRFPAAFDEYRQTLTEGIRQGKLAAPRQVRTLIEQISDWAAAGGGAGWFAGFVTGADAAQASANQDGAGGNGAHGGETAGTGAGRAALRADLDRAAAGAMAASLALRDWLAADYLPRAEGTPDGAGAERYQVGARVWTGADLDPEETYAWGWSQYQSLRDSIREQAAAVRPGATALEAMEYLNEQGPAIEGADAIVAWLQQITDEAIRDLDGTHFDLAARMRTCRARLAPSGSAAAPYYTYPSKDFSRPGQTWLPTLGRTRFPLWELVSTWYHESVPGHHLQLAQWMNLADELSLYQTSVGNVSGCSEGWALYAERLMDELGYLTDPGARLGYLDAQMMRAIRVVVDVGMHLELTIPDDSPLAPGQRWTPELATEFFATHSGRPRDFITSEISRYLSAPGQAISYKLGERAWLEGRQAAQRAQGASFDLKAWHMAALSAGALGLADLQEELAAL
jgi:uncharacterized protein (DUF885 family)